MAAIEAPEVIKLLREFGQWVALRGGNPYRAKAYARAAENLGTLTVPLGEVIPEGRLREIPGIGEAIRAYGAAKGIPAAALSRGTAGVIGSCLVVNLPGSKGGVKDGLEVLAPILEHAVEQIVGSDH